MCSVYGAGTWAILKAEKPKIETFDVCCWRKTLKNSWTEKIKHVEVLKRFFSFSRALQWCKCPDEGGGGAFDKFQK